MSGFKYLHLMPIPNRFFEKSSTDEKRAFNQTEA